MRAFYNGKRWQVSPKGPTTRVRKALGGTNLLLLVARTPVALRAALTDPNAERAVGIGRGRYESAGLDQAGCGVDNSSVGAWFEWRRGMAEGGVVVAIGGWK